MAVIAAIVIGYYVRLYWPRRYVVYGVWGNVEGCVRLIAAHNLKYLRVWLSKVDDIQPYSEIYIYRKAKKKKSYELIKTIKWN